MPRRHSQTTIIDGGSPEHASIRLAVLPLRNISDDPRISMFCTGLVMDLITDLSRFRSFQIIAYDSIKGLHPNEQLHSPELEQLHADYVVKGLARFQQEKLLLNVQLINVADNRLVWAEKFSGSLDQLILVQEEITARIVSSLQQFVDEDILAQLRNKPMTNLGAYECWLQGMENLRKGSLEADEAARALFHKAISLDPHFARAYTGMSLTYFNEWSCQVWDRWEVSQTGAREWAEKALAIDDRDHISAAIMGKLSLFGGEYGKSEYYLREAVRLNPNDADILAEVSLSLTYLGYPADAFDLYEKAVRLNPSQAEHYAASGALALCEMGRFEEGVEIIERHSDSIRYVDFPVFMAAAYYHLGEHEKMHAARHEFLRRFNQIIQRDGQADELTALQWMVNVNPFRGDTFLRGFWEFAGNGKLVLPEATGTRHETLSRQSNVFTQENGLWTIGYAGAIVTLPEVKGFFDLARLLAQPGIQVHCSELMPGAVIEKGEAIFDQKAKSAYQKRILRIQEALEEAESLGDSSAIARLQSEYDALLDHLSAAVGRHGKTRKISEGTDKIRSAVTWRIRSAIKRIGEAHPDLGKHLNTAIKTGVFCSYSPETETNWQT